MTVDASARFHPRPGVHARRFDAELVILDLTGGQYYGLNEVGAEIWERLGRALSVGEIVDELGARFDVARDVLEGDVRSLISELVALGLIVAVPGDAP